jgi:hypothetical protein
MEQQNLATRLINVMCNYDPEIACEKHEDLLSFTLEEMETPEGLKTIIEGLIEVIEDMQEAAQ